AHRSTTTGVVRDRSSTSLWKVASVTSTMTMPEPLPDRAGGCAAPALAPPLPPRPAGPAGLPDPLPGGLPAGRPAGLAAGGRWNALRSTAPRVKIDWLSRRGSLMLLVLHARRGARPSPPDRPVAGCCPTSPSPARRRPAAGPPPACRRPPAGPPPARVRWPPVVRLTQDRSGGQDRA